MTTPIDVTNQEVGDPAVEVPCVIHLIDGRRFVVESVSGWIQHPLGIFANQGYWSTNPDVTCDVLIMYDRIDHVELDFAALQRYQAIQNGDHLND